MKRSKHLRLSLMTIALPAALAGCDDGPQSGVVLNSIDECGTRADVEVSVEQCRAAYQAAVAQHEKIAPRFENSVECFDQFSACQPLQVDGRDYWIPPMAGFLLGYAARRDHDHYIYSYGGSSLPLYRSTSGDFYNPAGGYVSRSSGAVHGDIGRASAPARAVTIGRGGFGASSAAHGSFGGGRGFGG